MFDALKKLQEPQVGADFSARRIISRPDLGYGEKIRQDFYAVRGKRALDIVGALVLLLVFSPIILVIALVMLPQRGGVFFGHRRVGQGGAGFACSSFAPWCRMPRQG